MPEHPLEAVADTVASIHYRIVEELEGIKGSMVRIIPKIEVL